jgi:hypothetical protein
VLNGQKCVSDKSGLGIDKFAASSSHAASTSRTMFVKPELSDPPIACFDKGKNIIVHENAKIESNIYVKKHSKSRFIPICHYCGIIGYSTKLSSDALSKTLN